MLRCIILVYINAFYSGGKCTKNLKETLAIVTAAVVSVAFTGGLLSTLHMVNHDVTASAEALKLRDSGRLGNCGYYDVNISYQVIEEQYWDDEVGAPVYNNYIEINSVYDDNDCSRWL